RSRRIRPPNARRYGFFASLRMTVQNDSKENPGCGDILAAQRCYLTLGAAARPRLLLMGLVLAVALFGCASTATPSGSGSRLSEERQRPATKRIVGAIAGNPNTLYQKLNTNSAIRGIAALELMV